MYYLWLDTSKKMCLILSKSKRRIIRKINKIIIIINIKIIINDSIDLIIVLTVLSKIINDTTNIAKILSWNENTKQF